MFPISAFQPAIISKIVHCGFIFRRHDVFHIKARMAELGMEPMIGTPEQMRERMAHEIKKWAVVIDKAGIPKQ
jgi:hypothetical protein